MIIRTRLAIEPILGAPVSIGTKHLPLVGKVISTHKGKHGDWEVDCEVEETVNTLPIMKKLGLGGKRIQMVKTEIRALLDEHGSLLIKYGRLVERQAKVQEHLEWSQADRTRLDEIEALLMSLAQDD